MAKYFAFTDNMEFFLTKKFITIWRLRYNFNSEIRENPASQLFHYYNYCIYYLIWFCIYNFFYSSVIIPETAVVSEKKHVFLTVQFRARTVLLMPMENKELLNTLLEKMVSKQKVMTCPHLLYPSVLHLHHNNMRHNPIQSDLLI